MTNSIQNVLLGDRVLIGAVSDTFVTNIQLRLKSGVSGFKLENANIEPVFCSSINQYSAHQLISIHAHVEYQTVLKFNTLSLMNIIFNYWGQ